VSSKPSVPSVPSAASGKPSAASSAASSGPSAASSAASSGPSAASSAASSGPSAASSASSSSSIIAIGIPNTISGDIKVELKDVASAIKKHISDMDTILTRETKNKYYIFNQQVHTTMFGNIVIGEWLTYTNDVTIKKDIEIHYNSTKNKIVSANSNNQILRILQSNNNKITVILNNGTHEEQEIDVKDVLNVYPSNITDCINEIKKPSNSEIQFPIIVSIGKQEDMGKDFNHIIKLINDATSKAQSLFSGASSAASSGPSSAVSAASAVSGPSAASAASTASAASGPSAVSGPSAANSAVSAASVQDAHKMYDIIIKCIDDGFKKFVDLIKKYDYFIIYNISAENKQYDMKIEYFNKTWQNIYGTTDEVKKIATDIINYYNNKKKDIDDKHPKKSYKDFISYTEKFIFYEDLIDNKNKRHEIKIKFDKILIAEPIESKNYVFYSDNNRIPILVLPSKTDAQRYIDKSMDHAIFEQKIMKIIAPVEGKIIKLKKITGEKKQSAIHNICNKIINHIELKSLELKELLKGDNVKYIHINRIVSIGREDIKKSFDEWEKIDNFALNNINIVRQVYREMIEHIENTYKDIKTFIYTIKYDNNNIPYRGDNKLNRKELLYIYPSDINGYIQESYDAEFSEKFPIIVVPSVKSEDIGLKSIKLLEEKLDNIITSQIVLLKKKGITVSQ
jgi:hypothetical protein